MARKVKEGRISIRGTIPGIKAAFGFLDGGGARVTIDLDPSCSEKYFAFMKLANSGLYRVVGELGLEKDDDDAFA